MSDFNDGEQRYDKPGGWTYRVLRNAMRNILIGTFAFIALVVTSTIAPANAAGAADAQPPMTQQQIQIASDKLIRALPFLTQMEQTVRSMATIFKQFESGTDDLLKNQREMQKLSKLNNELADTLGEMKLSLKGTPWDMLEKMELKPADSYARPVENFDRLTEDLGKILQAEAFIEAWKKENRL